MKFSILTLFPEFFDCLNNYSIIGRAIKEAKIELETVNIRDFSQNKHGQVDDYSYGGGPGMVMQVGPIYRAIESVKKNNSKVVYLSPKGRVLTQKKLIEYSNLEHLILLNGHYEGIDNRVVENYIDEEISIGDYVLTGAEIPSMVLIDGIARLIPGVLSSEESYSLESHYNGLLEYPQYTRPKEFNGLEVPDVLLSGDHKKIEQYRICQAIRTTLENRPDLIDRSKLSDIEKKYLDYIESERR
ncbi:tRNA (guanine37-N1)-methyltransferase [Anaerosphaera aminiphila DSM 21120]|uniref:tRNA (guanine-N(1)-)-methyltransferase n=1 Tax=Anaerosphaera aminiphila DSM 21120 TaxID=1120995 RepID=A0A1M5RFR9_9FIRM|nr:tRNA (guanosine(37)-N1)-methyltransferase TrmD [Anaerosphaera aminiphila]SHH25222.1 tRNA (guanine37-N1)-methyltransferase [Anaerosphaera aminiphila DSM 21120]